MNEIAAVRPTKFAKYLKRAGYDVQVLAEKGETSVKDIILEEDKKDIPVTYIEASKWVVSFEKWYQKITKKYREKHYNDLSSRIRYNKKIGMEVFYIFEMLHPVLGTMDHLVRWMRELNLAKNARFYLKENANNIDICFSSFGWYFGHLCGAYIKKKNSKIRWIADFRDPVYREDYGSWLYRWMGKRYEDWSCKKSDAIVVVTSTMVRWLPQKFREKVYCITNGYDSEDLRFCEKVDKSEKLILSYTGRMYGGKQDLSKAFEAVAELINENLIMREMVEFHYAGTGFGVFSEQAKKYGIDDMCVNHGSVGRKESLTLQAESDILLVSAWQYKVNNTGAFCGKILEYMLHRKNILGVMQGNVKNTEFAIRIRETGIGEVYEEENGKEDFVKIKNYIQKIYENKCQGIDSTKEIREEVINEYEYCNLTKKLIEVMEK